MVSSHADLPLTTALLWAEAVQGIGTFAGTRAVGVCFDEMLPSDTSDLATAGPGRFHYSQAKIFYFLPLYVHLQELNDLKGIKNNRML